MAKRISQETFDEVVKENIEDFELSDLEALNDAISQFDKQGVDLSNIDRTGGVGRQEMLDAIDRLGSLIKTIDSTSEGLVEVLENISQMCFMNDTDISKVLAQRNQVLMQEMPGVNHLHSLMDKYTILEQTVLTKVLALLNKLSKANIEIRDFFEPGGSKRVSVILSSVVDRVTTKGDTAVYPLLISTLTLAQTASKSENNKVSLFKAGVPDLIVKLLQWLGGISADAPDTTVFNISADTDIADATKWSESQTTALKDACLLLRDLCVATDLRKDMSCAYENGRYFLKQPKVPQTLMVLSSRFRGYPTVASAALQAARCLVNTEEGVRMLSLHGALQLPRAILIWEDASVSLMRSAIALMRNLCADDIRKDKMVSDGTMDILIAAMNQEKCSSDASLMEHGFACLAAMTLRSPSNSQRIIDTGVAIDMIVRNMRRYKDKQSLQRQCCLAVRNIAARSPDVRQILLDAGVEDVLREAGRLQAVVDEAYGALRDLNCEVHYVKVNEEGKLEPMYEHFGATKSKLNFNPSYGEADDLGQRVVDEARAPFALDDDESDLEHTHGDCCAGDADVVQKQPFSD